MPTGVDKKAYFFAPFLTLMLALTSLSVIPFGAGHHGFSATPTNFGIADVNISLLVAFCHYRAGRVRDRAGWVGNPTTSIRCSEACAVRRR